MAPAANSRPSRGLDIEDALARWSEPAAYEAMMEYWDARDQVSVGPGVEPPPRVLRHQEYARRRKPLEQALHAKLAAAELAASVLPKARGPAVSREIVRPGLFHELEIAWDLDELVGLGIRLQSPEIFEPRSVPQNVWNVPPWYDEVFGLASRGTGTLEAQDPGSFRQSANYRRVELRGLSFSLTVAQARAVRRLHQALQKGDPWVPTREVLAAAHSESEKVAQLFRRQTKPHWSELIESNGKGLYRIRLD